MEKFILDEIMKLNGLENEESLSNINSFMLMHKSVDKIDLINTEDNKLFYQVSVEDVLNSDMDNEDMLTLHLNGEWQYNNDKTYLIKFLN